METLVKDKLRILLVPLQRFPPFHVDITVLFGKEIVGRGHTVDWLFQSGATKQRSYETEWLGCKALVGPNDNGASTLRKVKKNLYGIIHDLRMFDLARKGDYDCLLVRDKFLSSVPAIAASRLYKTKFIFWLSYPFPENYLFQVKEGTARYPFLYWLKGNFLRFLCYRIVMPCADHIFVQTEHMKKNVSKHGIAEEDMTPVPMAVDIDEIPFFGYETGPQSGREKSIVYLGTLFRTRKIGFLIRVLKKVLEKEKDARLYLVGGGEDPKDDEVINAEATRLGIGDRVTITGFLPQKEAWRYVQDASVCVSPIPPTPTLDCGSPTKLIEYLAMGKAAVANDHPEQSVVLAESGAGICVPYREDAFAEAILYLLSHPQEASEMGRRGREYIEKRRTYKQAADLVESKLLSLCNTEDFVRS